jgi:phenylalanyl-tRNA synthetase beta chain
MRTLTVCRVDAGTGAPLAIVCGAPNAAAGMKVPCALVGAKLPGESPDKPFEIRPATMRGVQSQGMLCSAAAQALKRRQPACVPADAPVSRDCGPTPERQAISVAHANRAIASRCWAWRAKSPR